MIKVFFISSQLNNNFGVNQVIFSLKKFLSKQCIFLHKKSLFKFLRSKYDLIHIHGCWKLNILFFFIFSKLKKVKIIISPHGMLDPHSLNQKKFMKFIAWHLFQKYIFMFSNQIIVNSLKEKKNVLDILNHSNIKVIPHGIELKTNFKKKANKKNSKLKFVFFSRIHKSKNLMQLINLWTNDVFFKKFNLSIYGEISDFKYFDLLKAKIKRFQNIKYKGSLYKNKIQKLSVYDIFIFPSKSENFGLVILEALASGLYLILNNNLPWQHLSQKGFATLINFQKNSLKKEIKNLEKIKKKIRSPKYIKKSYSYLSTNYSWKEISNDYVDNYNKVLKKP